MYMACRGRHCQGDITCTWLVGEEHSQGDITWLVGENSARLVGEENCQGDITWLVGEDTAG